MTNLKKFLLILSSAVMCLSVCACSVGPAEDSSTSDSSSVSENEDSFADESADESTEEATEEAPVQADIPLEFDGSEVPDAAAKTIGAYFKAIMNQDYNSYKETLDPYYLDVYNTWLDGSFGYGMETSFETMHQSLMDAASVDEEGNAVTVEKMTITKLQLRETVVDEGEDITSLINDYLTQYDSVIGEGFTDGLRAQCDDVINVTFTMTADCDGTERVIMSDMEVLLTVHGDEYKLLG